MADGSLIFSHYPTIGYIDYHELIFIVPMVNNEIKTIYVHQYAP
jgi:hypothetical protein